MGSVVWEFSLAVISLTLLIYNFNTCFLRVMNTQEVETQQEIVLKNALQS
jgi:hypothetical protein